ISCVIDLRSNTPRTHIPLRPNLGVLRIEAMREELLQFKLQEVWTLVDLPNGKKVIGSKWVFKNKKDERGIVIRNKARLVAQGYIQYTQEEGIDYDEVFALVTHKDSHNKRHDPEVGED
ncbi:putative ribonuclease H-like domain-containing protein, partial [Tanacetum coccineum]